MRKTEEYGAGVLDIESQSFR